MSCHHILKKLSFLNPGSNEGFCFFQDSTYDVASKKERRTYKFSQIKCGIVESYPIEMWAAGCGWRKKCRLVCLRGMSRDRVLLALQGLKYKRVIF
jgi:hypothetical protein